MKVILQKDVAKLGKRHSVVEVPDGYALNKLIPQKMALPASAENLKRIHNIKAEATASFEAGEDAYKASIKELSTKKIEVQADANAQGHLFKAVKASDIHEALVSAGVVAIPVDAIVITTPIKSAGEHIVPVHFHDHRDSVTIEVIAK
ncbi:MAG: 50S ribosomal protein L9 [Candidatus Paceibacteria bacterium]